MEINDFEILLIGATFYHQEHVQILVFSMIRKNGGKNEYNRDRLLKALTMIII